MTEERSEIEGKMDVLCRFHTEYGHLRNQNRGRGINDECDSKCFAFRPLLFLKGHKPIQDTNETVVRFD
jgi:hypothetical protein